MKHVATEATARPATAASHLTHMTVAEDGSITVPSEVARRFGLVPGAAARIDIAPDGNTLALRRPISSLAQVYIELTNGCNIDCRTCMRNVWSLETGFMDDDTFEQLRTQIAQMPELPSVFFGGFGEPMHHPGITKYIRAMREIGCAVDLITNGTLLSEQRIDELIGAGLRRIWVSLDGARPESYSDVRLGASLPLVLRNLERLRHRKRLLSRTTPELGIAFVAMDRNIGDLPEVVQIGLDLGAEHFSVSNVLPHNEELNDQTLYDNEMARWNPRRADIDLARIDLSDPRVAEAIRGVLSAGSRTRGSVDLGFSPGANRCPFIDKGSVSVRWDGSVSACLALLHTHTYYIGEHARTSHEHSFGSIAEESLTGIWNSPEYVDFRRRLEEFSFSPCTTCRSCERIEENRDDCTNSGHPACGGCLWAQGFIRCP